MQRRSHVSPRTSHVDHAVRVRTDRHGVLVGRDKLVVEIVQSPQTVEGHALVTVRRTRRHSRVLQSKHS